MKMTGIITASAVALLVGAKLAIVAFAPVLPPDFDRQWDDDFEQAYWSAHYWTQDQVDFYNLNGRWATDVEELILDGRNAEVLLRWKERDPAAWRRHVDERADQMTFGEADAHRFTATYYSIEVVDGRVRTTDSARCTVEVDAEYARAFGAWMATPGARASRQLPDELNRWSRMDCRRTSGLRAWFSWAGLDRYREPPAERYSALSYAQRAWEREGNAYTPEAGDAPRP